MAKVIDITEKLNFEEKPQIKVKDTILTVNNEAFAFLKVYPKLEGNMTPEIIDEICSTLFEPSEIEKIDSLKLNIKDFMVLVNSAAEAIIGDVEQGETVTHATT